MALVRGTFGVDPRALDLKTLGQLHGEAIYLKQLDMEVMQAAFVKALQQTQL